MKDDGISLGEPRKVKLDEVKICQLMAVLTEMWPDVGGRQIARGNLHLVSSQEKLLPRAQAPRTNGARMLMIESIAREMLELPKAGPELKMAPLKPKAGDLCSDPGAIDRANQLLKENLPEEFKREIGACEFAKPGGRPRKDESPKPNVDRVMVDRLKAMIRATWPDEFGTSKKVVQFPRARKRGAKVRKGPCAEVVRFRCGRADYSENQRDVFDILVKDGRSARFAAAMIDFMRSPYSKEGDDWFVRGGVSIADYMDQLKRQGI